MTRLHCVFFFLARYPRCVLIIHIQGVKKVVGSQSKHNFICLQSNYMFSLAVGDYIYSRNMFLVCTQIKAVLKL